MLSEREIERSKDYIRRRLDAELSIVAIVESLLKEVAKQIVEVAFKDNPSMKTFALTDLSYKAKQKIEEIIQWLIKMLENSIYLFCVESESENKDNIFLWLKNPLNGVILTDKIKEYSRNYLAELETLINAGVFIGISMQQIIKSIQTNIKQPYANPELLDGIRKNVTYGKGKTNSMFTAISRLSRFNVARGWMKDKIDNDIENGVQRWQVMRGSIYPCSLCDSYVGIQYLEEMLPPYHANCCCYFIPVRDTE